MEKEKSFIAIFSGSWDDISHFDFSDLNLKFINLKNPDLKKTLNSLEIRENGVYNNILYILKENGDSDYMYALIPIDFSQEIDAQSFWTVRDILLLIFPSDITLHHLIDIDYVDQKIHCPGYTSYKFFPTGFDNMFDEYLTYDSEKLEEINEFIKLAIERIEKIKYIKSALHSYLSSYFQNFKEMEFVNLCIALESTVVAQTELNYRIKRNVSILLTSEKDFARNIFKNVGKIYSLRSKIVHSGKYKIEKVEEYLPYLKNLTSRLIIEMIAQNIEKLEILNDILTEKGFGDNTSISEDYKPYILNTGARANALAHKLE